MAHLASSTIGALLKTPPLPREIERVIGVPLRETEGAGAMRYFEAALGRNAFSKIELRQNTATGLSFLVLYAQPDPAIHEDDLDMSVYGPVRDISVNPDFPPEGTYGYLYDVGGVRLRFGFTDQSKVLTVVSLEWPGSDG